jgi:hypothetical protein
MHVLAPEGQQFPDTPGPRIKLISVVDRHRFDIDPDPDPISMLTRIRIGINMMPILMRILPQVSHMLENLNFFSTFSHSFAIIVLSIFHNTEKTGIGDKRSRVRMSNISGPKNDLSE